MLLDYTQIILLVGNYQLEELLHALVKFGAIGLDVIRKIILILL